MSKSTESKSNRVGREALRLNAIVIVVALGILTSNVSSKDLASQLEPASARTAPQLPYISDLSREEEQQLKATLAHTPLTLLKYVNSDPAPLALTGGELTFTKRDLPASPGDPINDYVFSGHINWKNTGPHTLTGIRLEFTSDKTRFFVAYKPSSSKESSGGTIVIDLMCVTGDPAELEVRAIGAELAGGIIWGDYPQPGGVGMPPGAPRQPPATRSPIPPTTSTAPDSTARPTDQPEQPVRPDARQTNSSGSTPNVNESTGGGVDQRPVPLNSPQPTYSERARRDRVSGTVVLRVLISAEGLVVKVTVLKPLPDFLTESAIRAAYSLRFKPAVKDGKQVAFAVPVNVDFNLR